MFRSFCVVSKAVTSGCRGYARRVRYDGGPAYERSRGDNPGADHTVKLFKKEGVILSKKEVELDMIEDDGETNLFNAHELHVQHEKEMRKKKADLPKHIVKEKYFNEVTPNLLTWSEKEQIRFLHSRDPDVWTPEKISQSFPCTESAAKKIIKVTWKPASQSRIERHDASALRNWKELKEGTLTDITPEMREHFLKFTNRTLPPRSHEKDEKSLALRNASKRGGEYESLLQIETSENANVPLEIASAKTAKSHSEIDKAHEKKVSPRLTLDQLRGNISDDLENNMNISEYDKRMLKPDEKLESLDKDELKTSYLDSLKRAPKSLESFGEDKKEIVHDFTKRIRIPKKAYQRNGTYKVQDAFYDSDGKFLYRVPGLLANISNTNTNPEASSTEKE